MHVLVIGRFYVEGFGLHIAETLTSMGHAVERFDPKPGSASPTKRSSGVLIRGQLRKRLDQVGSTVYETSDKVAGIRARRMERLWSLVREQPFDLVIVCHDFLLPAEVETLKSMNGAKVAMWFPDAIVNFRNAAFMNSPYDALFFKDPFIVKRLSDVLESPVYYLPECFNPERHKLPPVQETETNYSCDITTAGNLHSWRVAVFKHLADYDVKIWGNPPPEWLPLGPVAGMIQGRGVFYSDKAQAYRSARIVLTTLHCSEIWGVNVRCFEAAGVGAFQLIEWRIGLAQLFEDGTELVTYTTMQDLRRKIDYWLPRADERRAIGEAARRRALAEHTYRHRLDVMLGTLFDEAEGFPLPDMIA